MDKDRVLEDGIYDVSGIPYFIEQDREMRHIDNAGKGRPLSEDAKEFMDNYKDYVIGNAYGCPDSFILGWKPELIKEPTRKIGSGFNYGSTNLIENCPRSVLILAEDD